MAIPDTGIAIFLRKSKEGKGDKGILCGRVQVQ